MHIANVGVFIIFYIIPGLVALASLLVWASRFVNRQKIHPDLAISPLVSTAPAFRPSDVRIKLAHSGSVSLVIDEMRWGSHLDFPNQRERALAWFQLLRGYLTNDTEGLQTILGPRLVLAKAKRVSRITNRVLGILYLALLLTFCFTPIGWLAVILAILLASPNPPVELRAGDDEIELIDIRTKSEKRRPFLVRSGEEAEYILTHETSVHGCGFPSNYQVDFVNEIPQKSLWKLPRSYQFVRRPEEKLHIKTGGRWLTYSITPSTRFVRLSGPSSC